MRKKKTLPTIENITITDIAAEGKAIARIDDMVVFIPFVAPGDIVDIQITKKRKSYAEGRVLQIKKLSENRCEPFCQHFGTCGGCKWQHIPYEQQLAFKQQQVIDSLTRIGKIKLPDITPILGSEKIQYYRNKLEFTFSNKKWLTYEQMAQDKEYCRNGVGFHIPGMFDKVLDVQKCYLQDDIQNQLRNFLRDYCIEKEFSFFDLRAQQGFIRTMMVRTSSIGELMLIIVFFEDDEQKRNDLLNAVKESFPSITSLLYIINQKCNDTITDQTVHTFNGRDYIEEEMEGLRFRIGPKSFYQTNSEQAYNLYKITREYAELSGNELVYDLYTGTGTIANFVARKCRQVIGIEYVPEAIEDARINAEKNQLDNTLFYAGDMKDILTTAFVAEHGRPDVIITDPPRAGMHDDVINCILETEAKRVVYVSCNPATQARDLSLLDAKYKVTAVRPVDMFPHTHHVENVVQLTLR